MNQLCLLTYKNGEPTYFSLGRAQITTKCFVCNGAGRWDKEGITHYPECGHIIHARCHYIRSDCPLCHINFHQVDVWNDERAKYIEDMRSNGGRAGHLIRLLVSHKMWVSDLANLAADDYKKKFMLPTDRFAIVGVADHPNPDFTRTFTPTHNDTFRAQAIAAALGPARLEAWSLSLETLYKQYKLMPGDVFAAFRFTPEQVNAASFHFTLEMEGSLRMQALCDFAFYGAEFQGIRVEQLKSFPARVLYILNYPYFRWKLMGLDPFLAPRVESHEWMHMLGQSIWTT